MELQEFIRNFMKERSNNYYQKFWSKTASQAGLTVKTPDGKEIMVKPEEIWCEDLGDVSGSCLCGHAIRYQYWLGKVGPIGSSCIQTITGLDGQDLRYILQGGQVARKETEELRQLIEQFKTLDGQLAADPILTERVNFVKDLNATPHAVLPFVEHNFPMPSSIRASIYAVYNRNQKLKNVKQLYGQEVFDCYTIHEQVAADFDKVVANLPKIFTNNEKFVHEIIRDIGHKVTSSSPSPKQLDFLVKLVKRLQNPQFIDAVNVLVTLYNCKDQIEEFWAKIITENLLKAMQFGLSDGQVNFILNKSASGKDGLAIRFKTLLTRKMIVEETIKAGDISVKAVPADPQCTLKNIIPIEEKTLDFESDMPI